MNARVIVTGSRDWARPGPVRVALIEAFAELNGWLTVSHGACPTGADRFAAEWLTEWIAGGRPLIADPWPADWDSCAWDCPPGHRRRKRPGDVHHPGMLPDYCPSAGPRRNAAMVAEGADLVIAFPLGRSLGTRGTMRLAERAGIPVRNLGAQR